ncbi:unnamed protein product [Rotaria sp. Silwood2]|nr:unnamed protein product [Rotaria sp. Silwood2]
MLSTYFTLLQLPCHELSEWRELWPLYLIIPLRLIAFNIYSVELSEKDTFKWISIEILKHGLISTNSKSNEGDVGWTSLVHSALRILLEITRSEPQLLNELREDKESLAKILDTLRQLSNDIQNEAVQLQAFELIVLIVPEEELSQSVNTKQKFDESMTVENVDDEKHKELRKELFYGLKSVVQNHALSEQLVQQNIISPLIRYAEESPNDEVPFEIIYVLLFTAHGKEELRREQYKNFVDHVKQLRQSGKAEVQQAALGIIWKIEDEDKLKYKCEHQEIYPPLMLTNSQMLTEKIVPLIVEPKYTADGWLGFIAGNKVFVNFARTNEHEFETAYKALVVELQRNGLPLLKRSNDLEFSDIQLQKAKNKLDLPLLTPSEMGCSVLKSEVTVNDRVPTTEYRDIEQINNWNEQNVIEFLLDQNLNTLLTALKDVSAFAGHSWLISPDKLLQNTFISKDDLISIDRSKFNNSYANFNEECKKYANDSKVKIIGDMPIYVDYDSADVWSNFHIFQLDHDDIMKLTVVAVLNNISICYYLTGFPPDHSSTKVQNWYMPIYLWNNKNVRKDLFDWWIKRLCRAFSTVDLLRIDHFRGLESHYVVLVDIKTQK